MLNGFQELLGAVLKSTTSYTSKLMFFTTAKSYQQKVIRFFGQILRFLKISTYFLFAFLSKYSDKNFQKSVQPAAPKYFVWN